MSAKLTQKLVDQWLEAAWRDGFSKGGDGTDDSPDFSTLDPRGPSEDKPKMDPAALSRAPYDPDRCSARMYRQGHGVQCTRKHLQGCDGLCKTHHNKFIILPDGADIRFGRYNAGRPTHWMDAIGGDKIGWKDLRSKSPEKKPRVPAKEMRDKLTELGISVDGLKGKILTEKYREAIQQHEIDAQIGDVVSDIVSSVEQSETNTEQTDQEEVVQEAVQEEVVQEAVQEEAVQEEVVQEAVQEEVVQEQVITPASHLSPVSEGEMGDMLEETQEQQSEQDDGAGTGLTAMEGPSTITEYKKLFKELNISTEGLKGKRGFVAAYEKYISEMDEKTEDMSDDELEEDTRNFDEIDYEGVGYLEDEDTGKIYSLDHTYVGKWDDTASDIIWSNDTARTNHESKKD